MTTVRAVYENGVLRPTQPLALAEGETVELTVSKPAATEKPPLTLEEWGRRLMAAKNVQEWVELANSCPDPGPDYDIMKAINESRRLTGFRVPDPEPGEGSRG
jgi:predicted DNA-binding antitoxin AbrB/MazE fold protein